MESQKPELCGLPLFRMSVEASGWHYDGQNKLCQEDNHQYIRLKIYLLLLYYDSVARGS